jgi:hypothetical protein
MLVSPRLSMGCHCEVSIHSHCWREPNRFRSLDSFAISASISGRFGPPPVVVRCSQFIQEKDGAWAWEQVTRPGPTIDRVG